MNLASPPPQTAVRAVRISTSPWPLRLDPPACAASARRCRRASSPTRNWRRRSTRRTNGSSSAPASASVISPATAKRLDASRPRRPTRRSRHGGLEAADIDLIIVATSTPDYTFPAVATQVQAALGIVEGAAFDLQAVCTGFVYAVATADKFLRSGSHKRALVIGAETFSRILDWSDRTTCVLFGDGAGAIVLEARDSDGRLASPGVIASRLRADGRHRAKLYVDGGPSTTQTVGHLRMEGKEVFRHAVGMVTDVIQGCFADAGVTADEIDWFVPHQANRRIIDASADKLGIAAREGDRHRRPARQHLRRLDPAGARRRGLRRPHQAGRPRDDRSDGRRLHLGRGADPLVTGAVNPQLCWGGLDAGAPDWVAADRRAYANAKMRFQSFFMLTTIQPSFFASS